MVKSENNKSYFMYVKALLPIRYRFGKLVEGEKTSFSKLLII